MSISSPVTNDAQLYLIVLYSGMEHSADPEEIQHLEKFLDGVIPPEDAGASSGL